MNTLKRGRNTRRQKSRKLIVPRHSDNEPDIRDRAELYTDPNKYTRSEEASMIEPNVPLDAEFDQIYHKLVTKIKNQIDRSELPSISLKK